MSKYIDVDRLRAGINQNLSEAEFFEYNDDPTIAAHFRGQVLAYSTVLEGIASLQQEQPDVDLEKEAKDCWDYVFALGWDDNSFMTMNYKEFFAFARHFYELGQKDAANKYDEIEYNRQRAEEEK